MVRAEGLVAGRTGQPDGDAPSVVSWRPAEQAAREGERKEPPPQLKAQMEEMSKLSVGEPGFLDLLQPWLFSP